MLMENSLRSKPVRVFWAALIIVFTVIGLSRISDLSYIMSHMFSSGLNSRGGIYEAIAMLSAPLVVFFWLWLIFKKKEYLDALVFQILIFPFTHKANAAFAINAYTNQAGYTQKISLTTAMILFLFIVMIYNGKIMRPSNRSWRQFEKILLFYGLSLTLSQLFNHTMFSSLALTLGGAWQYIILFYITSSLIRTRANVLRLLSGVTLFAVINIIFRILSEGQAFLQRLSDEMVRVGSGAMGPAVSYGGYLAIILTITLLLYRVKQQNRYLLSFAVVFVELLSTFTRGSTLSLIFLSLLLFYKSERKYIYKISIIILPLLLVLGQSIWEYMTLRGSPFNTQMLQLDNVQVRIEIFIQYFTRVFDFSLVGNGIGNFTLISNSITSPLIPHNIIISLIDQAGIIVAATFLVAFIYSLLVSVRLAHAKRRSDIGVISRYILIALIQWFFFANTTSTLLNWYYPYEASAIFWMLLFLPPIIDGLPEYSPPVSANLRAL